MASHASSDSLDLASAVQSELVFLRKDPLWNHEKPYRLRYQPVRDVLQSNMVVESVPVTIHDMRPGISNLSLEKNGFAVHQLNSKLDYGDFIDYEKVTAIYMKEVKELVKTVCKAKHAHPLDFELRRRHETFPISTGERYEFGQPNLVTHADITLQSLQDIIRQIYGTAADTIMKSRIQCITVWKPLKGPVEDWPLALCDARTLNSEDVVPADAVYERTVAENLMIHHNPEQSWYYLDGQEASEALVFKAADSDPDLSAICAHGSFKLPRQLNTAPRESIDIRVLVMHADIDYPEESDWYT